MPLEQLRPITFDASPEVTILYRVWQELGGQTPVISRTSYEFATALRDVSASDGIVVMTHGGAGRNSGIDKTRFIDDAGHGLLYSRVPQVECWVLYGFSCHQHKDTSPLRHARQSLLCNGDAFNTDLVSILFALASAPDPFDARAVLASRPALPGTWYLHPSAPDPS